jgi:hypothetical protein
MSERRVAVLGILLATAAITVVAVVLLRDWDARPRPFTAAVPQPSPLISTPVIRVKPTQSACLDPVTFLPTSQVATLRIGTRSRPGVDVTATATGSGGYRSTDRIPGSAWKDNDLLTFALRPPERPVHGRFCVRNDGRRTVDVYAADDRTRSFSVTRIGGRRQPANIQLAFAERAPGTIGGHRARIVDEITVFRPAVVGPALVWILGALILAGCTLGVGAVMLLAARADQRED